MNGSFPPISRFTRATRSAQAAATRLPVATEPVKATPSTRGSRTIASPTSPAPATHVERAGREVLEARGQHQRGQRRELGRLRHDRVAGGQRRRHLPRQQQERVVPGHDAAPHAERLLEDERQLGGLDRGDHAPREVAPHLGVVVESRRGPADLVGVLEQRLAALERHHARDLLGLAPQPGGHLVEKLGALDRRHGAPRRRGRGRRGDGRLHLLGSGAPDVHEVSSVAGFSTASEGPAPRGLLAADQQSGLHRGSRPYGAASMALFTVSGLVKIWSGLASYTGTLAARRSRSRSARSLACASWESCTSPPPSAHGCVMMAGGSGNSAGSRSGWPASRSCGRCCSRTGGACSGSRARSGS